jgi:hypothetical protein
MSTRSYIVIEEKKKSGELYYEGIYCHWDGYPRNNGQILFDHYQDREKVEKLISLGDISSLAEEIDATEPTHSFDTPVKGVTIFYGRDRGEEGVGPKVVSLEELADDIFIEYVYIYTLRNEWLCFAYNHMDKIARLSDVLENEDILYPEDEES